MANSVTFPTALGGNGQKYTDDADPDTGLDDLGYTTRFVPCLQQVVAMASSSYDSAHSAEQSSEAAEQFLSAIQQVARDMGVIYKPLAVPVLDVDFTDNTCRYFDGKKMVTMPVDEAFVFLRASAALEFGPAGRLIEYGTNEPAFAFDPETGEAVGSVIRGDFTNHIVYSRLQTGWSSSNITTQAEDVLTFGGDVRNLRHWIPTTTYGNHYIYSGSNADVTPDTQYTVSVCVPSDTTYRCRFIFRSSSGEYPGGSGVLGSSDIVEKANGWIRFKYTFTTPGDCHDLQIRLYLYDGSNISFKGDGEQGVLIDHIQMVEGDQAGPIIPTSDSPSTRAADRVRNNAAVKFNHHELTVYVEADINSPDNFRGNFFTLTNGYFSNSLTLSKSNSNLARARWYIEQGSTYNFTFRTASSGFNKIAISIDSGGLDIACNGSYEGRLDLTETVSISIMDQIVLSNLRTLGDSYQTVNKKIKRIAVYPRVLSNAEKQGLTT